LTTFHKLSSRLIRQTSKLSVFCLTIVLLSCSNNSTRGKKYNELTEKDYEHKVDTVDGEEIYFKTAVSASTPQDFTNLDTTQKLFIKHYLEDAGTLIRKHLPNSSVANFTPQTLDSLIDLWNTDSAKFACSEDYFVNTVGTAFGQFLVKTYQMKWAMVTDKYGTDYATTISELHVSNFPLNSVLKAIEQKRGGSLQQISLITKRQIGELKKDK
jgi:hypothetical protein